MRRSIPALGAAALALAGLLTAPASPAPAAEPARRECGRLRIDDSLPLPAEGRRVRRTAVVDGNCQVAYGRVEVAAVAGTKAGPRAYRTSSDMYDCCNILMTSLTTRTDATSSTYDTHVNREPWNAGWTVQDVARTTGSTVTTRAEFGYRGIFDPTGRWYHNTHETSVTVAADGTATCRQSVQLRHAFIGWHWEHSCS
ncbi:hypothetical protein [Couchioplanes azureus]|uniref:hypothetical protein n=1 Tax=Couchioplanes caeruleus TaxID=56438 RepID=UPI0016703608|nr:hypothetical protein [Couchioplanes caeruleus]GGQ81543.1 hypothetical protein GCM10010166_59580 [Couchioplanes caeruleus subsp. azureus]